MAKREGTLSPIKQAVDAVSLDEPCLRLTEMHSLAPNKGGWHRYQTITVMRNDRPATCTRDLGHRDQFEASEFHIPGGVVDEYTGRITILHTVGELIDIADHMRDRRENFTLTRDIWADYAEQVDQKQRLTSGRSTYGPGGSVTRG
jgi:hypothetical protein